MQITYLIWMLSSYIISKRNCSLILNRILINICDYIKVCYFNRLTSLLSLSFLFCFISKRPENRRFVWVVLSRSLFATHWMPQELMQGTKIYGTHCVSNTVYEIIHINFIHLLARNSFVLMKTKNSSSHSPRTSFCFERKRLI